jgi:hypothetical protein
MEWNFPLIHAIFVILAIYLSFKRNDGFNLASFLVALIFPQLYVIYVFATEDNLKNLLPGTPPSHQRIYYTN